MKICTGFLKSMKILPPPKGSTTTRPTGAKIREALVNILSPWIHGSNIVDFFAGTGAIGLELISNGANHCTFVEENPKVVLGLKKNITQAQTLLKNSEHQSSIKILCKNSKNSIKLLKQSEWDIFWADPPYQESLEWFVYLQEHLMALAQPKSIFVLEVSKKTAPLCLEKKNKEWILYRQKNYGDTSLLIFSYKETLQ
jgi:16S rRNA (guanine966-N2)-methyltransferase